MMRIPYFLIENSEASGRFTVFHLLSLSELDLLRSFMALFLFPADLKSLDGSQPQFTAAITRVRNMPTFRKLRASAPLPVIVREEILSHPVVILITAGEIPPWLPSLAAEHDVALLAQSPETVEAACQIPGLHAGLLRGFEDVREAYRVIRELLAVAGQSFGRIDARERCKDLAEMNLFDHRPRLAFIRPIALPQPGAGRPATYLLNRLSNNVDDPSLATDAPQSGVTLVPQFFNWLTKACAALAAFEDREAFPDHLGVARQQVEECHTTLINDGVPAAEKQRTMLALGERIAGTRWPARPLIALPVPRFDLAQGKAPDSIRLDPQHKESLRAGTQAASDFISRQVRTTFGTERRRRDYLAARDTLIQEQRLVACQTAWLAGAAGAVPFQLDVLPGQLYNVLHQLGQALAVDSRKVPELFRNVETVLSTVLPEGIEDQLYDGASPVVLFSDLPFEWTMVKQWPLCLTRPVARMPMGVGSWDTLSAVVQKHIQIDVLRPDRVLVFDLVEADDRVRGESDAFIHASASLGQDYMYARPANAQEFRAALAEFTPEIVVVYGHGDYSRIRDELSIRLRGTWAPVVELVPEAIVPPVWILSACSTSTTGAMRGCFVRQLLAKGAVCVVATLSRVEAFIASMFVGRLLTNIFSPRKAGMFSSFDEVFFATQFTTALLYDPLLPLLRRSRTDKTLRSTLASILADFFQWADQGHEDARKYRHEAAWMLGSLLARHDLAQRYQHTWDAGLVRPETLLFTVFGLPGNVEITEGKDGVGGMPNPSEKAQP